MVFIPNNTHRLFLVLQVDFTQLKFNPALWIKQPVVFKVRKSNHQVIHQNQWCFIPNNTHRLVLVPQVNFTQLNPTLRYG